jgi:hypothetical protein
MPLPVRLAVANNASWCDLVARAHGCATSIDADAWVSATRTPPFYPDAVTLRAGVAADRLLGRIDATPGCSIKDSYAGLDLTPYHFEVLFEAEWIARPSTSELLPAGLDFQVVRRDGPDVVYLGTADAAVSVVGNRTGDVVGLSNLSDGGSDDAWAGAIRALARCWPGLPLVGYERGEDLSAAHRAGFASIGPLRVWHLAA